MRNSNYCYGKGSVIFLKNDSNAVKKSSYLKGRPLLIVSNPLHIMKTCICCTFGTRDRPGIKCSLYDYNTNTQLSDHPTNIYPYSLVTINFNDISSSIGQIDYHIMKEVDECILFHLGVINKVPGYMQDHEDYLYGVEYNKITDELLIHDSSLNYTAKRKSNIPVGFCHDTDNDKNVSVCDDEGNGNCEVFSKNEEGNNCVKKSHRKRKQKGDLGHNMVVNSDIKDLIKFLSEEQVAIMISRFISVSDIAKRYHISSGDSSILRHRLTQYVMISALTKLNHNPRKLLKANDSEIVGIILLCHFYPDLVRKYNLDFLHSKISEVKTKYNINLENGIKWQKFRIGPLVK